MVVIVTTAVKTPQGNDNFYQTVPNLTSSFRTFVRALVNSTKALVSDVFDGITPANELSQALSSRLYTTINCQKNCGKRFTYILKYNVRVDCGCQETPRESNTHP